MTVVSCVLRSSTEPRRREVLLEEDVVVAQWFGSAFAINVESDREDYGVELSSPLSCKCMATARPVGKLAREMWRRSSGGRSDRQVLVKSCRARYSARLRVPFYHT